MNSNPSHALAHVQSCLAMNSHPSPRTLTRVQSYLADNAPSTERATQCHLLSCKPRHMPHLQPAESVQHLPVVETVPFSHFAGSFTFEAIGAGACSVRARPVFRSFLVSHHALVSGASYRCVICPRKPLVAGERRSENGACIVCSID